MAGQGESLPGRNICDLVKAEVFCIFVCYLMQRHSVFDIDCSVDKSEDGTVIANWYTEICFKVRSYFVRLPAISVSACYPRTLYYVFDGANAVRVVSTAVKYSLQGTTQGRYLTGGVPPVRFSM